MNTVIYFLFSVLLMLWCFLHSALISTQFVDFAKQKLGGYFRYYRIVYNLFSLFSLLPLMIFPNIIKEDLIFSYESYFRFIQVILLLLAFYLLFEGAKAYDLLSFLGFHQMQGTEHYKTLSTHGKITTSGILSKVRHPWYTATFLILWSRNISISTLLVNVIFTLYLIIGCLLEEKKLVLEFGDEYRKYQQNVSMLFPWKWLKTKLKG